MPWYLLILVVLGTLAYFVYLSRVNKRFLESQQSVFRQRPLLDADAWFVQGFGGLGFPRERVVAILEPVARTMGCEITQLLPSDSFDGNLCWRGRTFLGIDDGNPWDEYAEQSLPDICGSDEKATDVLERIQGNPTLAELVKAVASATLVTPARSAS